jgi:hypothetical protein
MGETSFDGYRDSYLTLRGDVSMEEKEEFSRFCGDEGIENGMSEEAEI